MNTADHPYSLEFTRRTVRVLRTIQMGSGRVKIDIRDNRNPYDTRIVDAWVVEENTVLWLEYEADGHKTVRIGLARALQCARQPKW